jgi:MFS family permease
VTATEEPVRFRWILAAVSMALFCVQIDYFAMNLALPRMALDLKTTAPDLQWVISVYMLALGAFMVPAGRIGRSCVRWPRRRRWSSSFAPCRALVRH